MKRKKGLTIFVAENISIKAARDIISGVMRYAASNHRWNVVVHGGHPMERSSVRTSCRPDGIITGYSPEDPENPVPLRIRRDIPTVFTCTPAQPGMKAPCTSINADDKAIGEAAARCLAKSNIKNFAFIGWQKDAEWQRLRLAGFSDTLRKAGHACRCSHMANMSGSWTKERDSILRWIESIPTPCGIFASYDYWARLVLDICREAGIKVPAQVQVLGVDNETYFCEYTVPTLSSISPDFEEGGFLAAQALDALIDGRPPPRTNRFGIAEVVERASTSDNSGAGNRVARARDIIRSELKSAISVAAIARKVGCSTRLLEKDFKAVLGKSVVREICDIRMTRATSLLKHTAKDEESIARACGYGSLGTLRNAFRARFKTTMREWRATQSKNREH